MEFQTYYRIMSLIADGMETYDVAPIPKSPTGRQFTTATPKSG